MSTQGRSRWRRAAALPLLALCACGGGTESPAAEPPTELVFTEADGTTFSLTPRAAECGPSEYDERVQVVRIRSITKDHNLVVEVVPSDVEGGKVFDLPISSGDGETGPANVIFFYGSSEFEVSTDLEESTGSLEVLRASCDPVALELDIDAALASEYGDGPGLEVKGHVDLTG